jgi:hypothetical protein
MPIIRCPDCERSLKAPDDARGKAVRCPCGRKIVVDEAGDEGLVGARPAPRSSRPEPPPDDRRRADRDDDRPGKRRPSRRPQPIHGLQWLLILGPAGVVLLILAPSFKIAAQVTAGTGLVVMLVGVTMVYRLGKTTGLNEELDAVPAALRGGGALLFYQLKFAVLFPRVLASWVVLELFGMALLLAGGIIFESVNWAAKERPYQPPPATPAVAVTGDAQLDRLLSDLAGPGTAQGAGDQLARMRPDEHRPAVAQKLAQLTTDPNNFVRKAAIKALGVWATPKEVADLIRCFEDFGSRAEAADALRAVGPAAEEALLPFLQRRGGRDSDLCRDAIGVLKDIGTPKSVAALQDVAATAMGYLSGPAKEALAAIAARDNK